MYVLTREDGSSQFLQFSGGRATGSRHFCLASIETCRGFDSPVILQKQRDEPAVEGLCHWIDAYGMVEITHSIIQTGLGKNVLILAKHPYDPLIAEMSLVRNRPDRYVVRAKKCPEVTPNRL